MVMTCPSLLYSLRMGQRLQGMRFFITFEQGISLLRGYSPADWNTQNSTDYETIIEDESDDGGAGSSGENQHFEAQ